MCIGHINGVVWAGMGCMTNHRGPTFDNIVLKSLEQLKNLTDFRLFFDKIEVDFKCFLINCLCLPIYRVST